jgi:hypothetical protein
VSRRNVKRTEEEAEGKRKETLRSSIFRFMMLDYLAPPLVLASLRTSLLSGGGGCKRGGEAVPEAYSCACLAWL